MNFTYVLTSTGTVITGGAITEVTFRNDAGQIVATLSGFTPLDAANFYAVRAASDSTAAYELLTNLTDGDSVITGSAVANGAVAGTGNDVATMGAGNDHIVKFDPGNLMYDGGAGSDLLSFAAEIGVAFPNPVVQQLVVDLATGIGTNPYGGTLTLTSVENIFGTPQPDVVTGNDDANIIGDAITETAGDIIDARGGDDTVGFFSFADVDPSLPGAQIDGGAGLDTLVFQYQQPGHVLDLADPASNAGMFRASTFANFERFVVGSDFSTVNGSLVFRGDDSGNDLSVRQGALTIDLRGGDDTLRLPDAQPSDPVTADGGAGTDRLVVRTGGVLDLAAPASNTGGFANGTFVNFEIFESAPLAEPALTNPVNQAFALDFRGDASPQTIIGSFENDTFLGRGGNDTMLGGAGADTYVWSSGDGNDTIIEDGPAAAIFQGSLSIAQTDVLRLTGLNPADVTLTRAGNNLVVTLTATSETVLVTDHFLGGAKGIEQIQFAATTFSRQQIIDNLVGGAPDASPVVAATLQSVGAEDSGVEIIDLLAGAADANGDTLHVANVNGLAPGLTLVGDTLRIDRGDASSQGLNAGGNRSFNVTYDIVDGNGGSVGQLARVFVTGANDAAVIGGDTTGLVTEDGTLGASGFLSITDVDTNTINGLSEARFRVQSNVATAFGTFNLVDAAAGLWIYQLDNANPTVQALNAGQTLTDTIPVLAFDGTTSNVVITINGVTDGGPPPTPVVSIAIAPASGDEGSSFTLTASRTGADLSQASTVSYAISGAAGNAGDIATALTGTLTIAAGTSSTTLSIATVQDTVVEPDEAFTVTISNPVNGTIGTETASATILNDDTTPPPPAPVVSIAIAPASADEGSSFTLTASRTGADLSQASTVSYAISGAAGNAGDIATALTGTLTIAANETSATLSIATVEDAVVEPDEAFTVTISNPVNGTLGTGTASATILNNDTTPPPPAPVVSIAIAPASADEGSSFTLTASRTGADLSQASTVSYAISGAAGNAGDIATALTGTLTIAAGTSSTTLSIATVQDTVVEPDEAFTVTISNPVNGTIGTETASATILNDDTTPPGDHSPIIVSGGGGDKATYVIQEHTRFITEVQATDAGDHIVYSIVGNSRKSPFTIDSETGELRLKHPANDDRNYTVTVKATDLEGNSDTQKIVVKVADDHIRAAVEAEHFVFREGFDGEARINGFAVTGSKHDVLELDHDLFSRFDSVEELLASDQVEQHGRHVELTTDRCDVIELRNVSLGALRAHPEDIWLV